MEINFSNKNIFLKQIKKMDYIIMTIKGPWKVKEVVYDVSLFVFIWVSVYKLLFLSNCALVKCKKYIIIN